MNIIKSQTLSNIDYMGLYIFIHVNPKQSFPLRRKDNKWLYHRRLCLKIRFYIKFYIKMQWKCFKYYQLKLNGLGEM
jgi:hypothetical protein